eukprot:1144903-Pelagomonas_calceolata.AAC.3
MLHLNQQGEAAPVAATRQEKKSSSKEQRDCEVCVRLASAGESIIAWHHRDIYLDTTHQRCSVKEAGTVGQWLAYCKFFRRSTT